MFSEYCLLSSFGTLSVYLKTDSMSDLTPAQRLVLTAVAESGKDNATAIVIEA